MITVAYYMPGPATTTSATAVTNMTMNQEHMVHDTVHDTKSIHHYMTDALHVELVEGVAGSGQLSNHSCGGVDTEIEPITLPNHRNPNQ